MYLYQVSMLKEDVDKKIAQESTSNESLHNGEATSCVQHHSRNCKESLAEITAILIKLTTSISMTLLFTTWQWPDRVGCVVLRLL